MINKVSIAYIAFTCGAAMAQPELDVEYEMYCAQDIRDWCSCSLSDIQFEGVRGIATDGDTLIVGRTNKIRDETVVAPAGEPYVAGTILVYRRNTSGTGPEWNLVDNQNDSVIGYPGSSLVSPDDWYGWDVALNGNTLAVSAPYYPHYDDNSSLSPSLEVSDPGSYGYEDATGAVFIYTRPNSLSDTWTLQQVIYDSIEVNGERFGYRLMFHDGRLLIASSRNHRPGYSGLSSMTCLNISSSIEVLDYSASTSEWVHQQTIDLPFMPGEAGYSYTPNSDPVDDSGPCAGSGPFPQPVPPIDSRMDGVGFGLERARDFDVDDDWLVTVGNPGMFVYQWNSGSGQYDLEQTIPTSVLPTGYDTGSKGFTAVSIDNNVIAVGIKNMMQSGTGDVGGIAVFELDTTASSDPWYITYADTIGGGNGIFLNNDTILMTSAVMWRYDRANNDIWRVGNVDDAGGSPHAKSTYYDNTFLLSSCVSRGEVASVGANNIYAVSMCPYDLNGDGSLDSSDLTEFNTRYAASDMRADYAEPYGTLNYFDVNHYVALYNSGCP